MTPLITAALALIQPRTIVGLGGGHNVQKLAQALAAQPVAPTIATPSELTRQTCQQLGLSVLPTLPPHLAIMFDGADNLDTHWHALKSKGGIQTLEKLYAQQAERYVLLLPNSRLTAILDITLPLTIEVVAPAVAPTLRQLTQLGGTVQQRVATSVASFSRTPLGNPLIDCYFETAAQLISAAKIVSPQPGVISTSYFDHDVTDCLIFTTDQHVQHLQKGVF